MPTVDVRNLRNVALVSHSGAGKTSLSETLLFNANATTRVGRVEDGNTVSDYEPEEVKRGSSVQTTLISCAWDGQNSIPSWAYVKAPCAWAGHNSV